MGTLAGRGLVLPRGLSGTLILMLLVVAISVWVLVVPLGTPSPWERGDVERSTEFPHCVRQFLESAYWSPRSLPAGTRLLPRVFFLFSGEALLYRRVSVVCHTPTHKQRHREHVVWQTVESERLLWDASTPNCVNQYLNYCNIVWAS